MAKDKRTKRTSGGQVNLSALSSRAARTRTAPTEEPAARTSAPAPRRQNKKSVGRRVLLVLTLVLIVIGGFLFFEIFNIFFGSKGTGKWPVTSDYKTTPEAYSDKVAYYMVGLLGENPGSDMMALSVVCHDKKAGTLQIMELPRQLYLGNAGTWATQTVAGVWAHPAPLKWCDKCRRQVYEPELTDGKHNVKGCDTPITQMTGSSVENLMKVCNDCLGLPVDNYFILPQQALVKLVNLVGGLDVELDAAMTVEDIKYSAGRQTIDGAAALAYITPKKDTVNAELSMMKKRRQVFLALFDRLRRTPRETLDDDVIGPLQYGSTPIRTAQDSDAIIDLLGELAGVDATQVTVITMPGEATTLDRVALFTVHTDELVTALNSRFNPYGKTIERTDLLIEQIDSDEKADLQEQTMQAAIIEQSGV